MPSINTVAEQQPTLPMRVDACDRKHAGATAVTPPDRQPTRFRATGDKTRSGAGRTGAARVLVRSPKRPLAGSGVRTKVKGRKRASSSPAHRKGWRRRIDMSASEQLVSAISRSPGGERSALFCGLVLTQGWRPSDVARLDHRHVVKSVEGLKLYNAREGNTRALRPDVQRLLIAYLSGVGSSDGPLFVGRFNAPISANAVQQHIRRAAKAQGLEVSAFAGRRAKAHDLDIWANLNANPPSAVPVGVACNHAPPAKPHIADSGNAAVRKVALYRPYVIEPATHDNKTVSPPDGRRAPRRYR